MLDWPERCQLAHASLWEDSYRRLKLAHELLGQFGVFLTLLFSSASRSWEISSAVPCPPLAVSGILPFGRRRNRAYPFDARGDDNVPGVPDYLPARLGLLARVVADTRDCPGRKASERVFSGVKRLHTRRNRRTKLICDEKRQGRF